MELNRNIWIFLPEHADHAGEKVSPCGLTRAHDERSALEILQIFERAASFLT